MAAVSPASSPPPPALSPPPSANATSPSVSPPPPPHFSPPPQASSPAPTSHPPSKSTDPPANSPPPPTASPNSPPPPSTNPPPPPSSRSPRSPPPPSHQPPGHAPPPPSTKPPESSPPPPQQSNNSPTPPPPKSPESSPSPPTFVPPPNSDAAPPPSLSPPPSSNSTPTSPSPPSSDSSPASPAPPGIQTSLPPPSIVSKPSHTPPSPAVASPRIPSTNNSSGNASQSSEPTNGEGITTGGTVAISFVLGLMLLGIFGAVAFCFWKRKKKDSRHNGGYIVPTPVGYSQESDSALLKVQMAAAPLRNGSNSGKGMVHSPREPGGFGNSKSCFTYEELVEATNGFSSQHLLGEGGFGSVYKGSLPDGRDVAVKQLKIGGGQGEREFRSEVEIISRIHHRHLVSLVGYCIYESRRLLVYDYFPNNNLYFHLHGKFIAS